MALALLNGQPLLRLDFFQGRFGSWTADCQLQGEEAPAEGELVQLQIGSVVRVGTVENSGAPYAQPRCRVIGGAGKLGARQVDDVVLDPIDYGQVTLSAVMTDILVSAGEVPGDLSALDDTVVPQWQIVQERAVQALQRVFRQRPDLDLVCEHDGSFSARLRDFSVTVSNDDVRGIKPQERQLVLMVDDSAIEPGVTVSTQYGDYRCERIQYELDPTDTRSSLAARVWYT